MANQNFFQIEGTPEVFRGTTAGGKVTKGEAFSSEEQFIQAGGIRGQSGQPYWANVTSITPDQLRSARKIDISNAPKSNIDNTAVVVDSVNAQVNADAKAAADAAAKKVADAKTASDAAVSDITGILTQLESEGTEQAQAEEDAGIPGFAQQQADITGQIAVKTAEYNQLALQEEQMTTTEEGKPISLQHISGNIAQVQREFRSRKNMVASDLSLLQAQSLAINGKQAAAQSAVNRAIDLKYDSLRQKLDTKRFLFDVIREDLSDAEAAQLKVQEDILAREEADLAEKKANDIAIQNWAIQAAVAQAPAEIIEQIKNAPDQVTAAQIAAPYLVEEKEDKLLSPTEAATLGVPYGTTQSQAAAMGITPARYKSTVPSPQDEPETQEPLSINQIEQFRRSYGWTPPLGFTNSQLIQYMNDNPGATPEELEAGARQAGGGTIEPAQPQTNFPDTVGHIMNTITDDEMTFLFKKAKTAGVTQLLRLKRGDVQAYIESFQSKIEEAISQGYSKDEIKAVILGL